ncbi:hypothetical protein OPQ81_011061 [Rhizoctonia solani]|nr:hypothetical protein OPQ81_011061 [Rhizoctonia solani]
MAVPRSKSGMVSAICSMNTIENGSLIILVEHDLVNSELWIGSCVPGQSGIRRGAKQTSTHVLGAIYSTTTSTIVAVYYRSKLRRTENSSSHQILVSAHGHHIPIIGAISNTPRSLFSVVCTSLLTRHFETQSAQEMWQPLSITS